MRKKQANYQTRSTNWVASLRKAGFGKTCLSCDVMLRQTRASRTNTATVLPVSFVDENGNLMCKLRMFEETARVAERLRTVATLEVLFVFS